MTNPYLDLFKAPGTKAFALAGMIARMPISMTGIGIITMLSQVKGSYGLAGSVAATFALSCAILAPQISRMVDHFGQGRVLPVAAGLSALGMLSLLLCTWLDAPAWSLFVFAGLSGTMPSMSAMVRARWTEVYRGRPQVQTAYALESVLDEVCFIVGPPISVGLSVAVFPEAGPLIALLMLTVGVTAFVLQKATEPPVHPQSSSNSGSAIRAGVVKILTALLMAMGIIVGTIDVVSVAFAKDQGILAAASLVLSVYALGSCAAGMAFGAAKLKTPLHCLLLYGGMATALTAVPLLFVWNIATLAFAVFLAGIFFAPTMIVAMTLVEASVPSSKLTEGLTWLITGLGVGVACGAALSGWVIDLLGTRAGFFVALGAGSCVLAVSLYGYGYLAKQSQSPEAKSARA
ncbi:MAG TPA: MFS transporter [Dyella sp.]